MAAPNTPQEVCERVRELLAAEPWWASIMPLSVPEWCFVVDSAWWRAWCAHSGFSGGGGGGAAPGPLSWSALADGSGGVRRGLQHPEDYERLPESVHAYLQEQYGGGGRRMPLVSISKAGSLLNRALALTDSVDVQVLRYATEEEETAEEKEKEKKKEAEKGGAPAQATEAAKAQDKPSMGLTDKAAPAGGKKSNASMDPRRLEMLPSVTVHAEACVKDVVKLIKATKLGGKDRLSGRLLLVQPPQPWTTAIRKHVFDDGTAFDDIVRTIMLCWQIRTCDQQVVCTLPPELIRAIIGWLWDLTYYATALGHEPEDLSAALVALDLKRFVIETGRASVRQERSLDITDEEMNAMMACLPGAVAELSQRSRPAPVHVEHMTLVRRILCTPTPPIDIVLSYGIEQFVTPHLQSTDDALLMETLWALTNICSGTTAQCRRVLEVGAIPVVLRGMAHWTSGEVVNQAVMMLGNVAGDSAEARDYLIHLGAVRLVGEAFVRLGTFSQDAPRTLANLMRGRPMPPQQAMVEAMPYLVRMMQSDHPTAVTDALWALSYISDGPTGQIQLVIESGVLDVVMELSEFARSQESARAMQVPIVRVIGNVLTGDDHQAQFLVDRGAVPLLVDFFAKHETRSVRREAFWALSNVAAGTQAQKDALVELGGLELLREAIDGEAADVRKEALWTASNLLQGVTSRQLALDAARSFFPLLGAVLSGPDQQVVLVTLELIENVLQCAQEEGAEIAESSGLLDYIEQCQEHRSEQVYRKAAQLLQQFFMADEEDEGFTAANAPFQFGGAGGPNDSFSFGGAQGQPFSF